MAAVELPAPFTSTGDYVVAVGAFLEEHAWLYRCHVVDFITEDHWRTHAPADWRGPLESCTTAELAQLPAGVCPARAAAKHGGWPESFTLFIAAATTLALPRIPARDREDGWGQGAGAGPPAPVDHAAGARDPPGWLAGLQGRELPAGIKLNSRKSSSQLSKALSGGMAPKKRHECERLGGLVASLCAELRCGTVVDFGAGMGYLSQLLHFGHGLHVIAIDSASHQTRGAELRASRLRVALGRRPAAPAIAAAVPLDDVLPDPADEPEPSVEADGAGTNTRGGARRAPAARPVCHGCGMEADGSVTLTPCRLCSAVVYCSKACTQRGWKQLRHKVASPLPQGRSSCWVALNANTS